MRLDLKMNLKVSRVWTIRLLQFRFGYLGLVPIS